MLDLFPLLFVCLAIVTGLVDNPCRTCVKMETESSIFLESLSGQWQGYAMRTPIGKVTYDLNFRMLEKNKIKGTSYTNGRAIHTWVIASGAEGQLVLDFHSTFGDSWAKGLCVTQVDEKKGYLFSHGNPFQLKVWINHTANDKMLIEIFLRDQPHVSIVTSKSKSKS